VTTVGPSVVRAPPAARDTPSPLVDVRDLHVHYPIGGFSLRQQRRVIRAVDGVDLAIPRATTLGLVGESGSGKTTAGRAIVRLLDPTSGSIQFDGQEIAALGGERLRRLRKRFQMIFQDPYSSLNPRMTIAGIVGEALVIHGIGTRKEQAERVKELLNLVGLPPRAADRYPHQFSGGQRQRVGVARALAVDPDLIVADEPVSALDVSIRAQILDLLVRLQDRLDLTYVVVSHDLAAVRRISDVVAVMYLGRIMELAPTAQLFGGALHPYTIALISAVPIPDPALQVGRRRIILTGEIPSPADPPSGCHFHARCWLYRRLGEPERCRSERPPLSDLGAGHAAACHFSAEVEGTPEQRQAMGRGVPTAVGQATETGAAPAGSTNDGATSRTTDGDTRRIGGTG
jgi:peptide/nickel transport system ATP-binding protein